MRIKNKEIRQRRHRKEQKIKEGNRALRAEFGDKKSTAPKPAAKTTTKKAAPKKKAE
jgi:hypothetical protein